MARDTVLKTEILCHTAKKSEVLSILEKTGRIHLVDMSRIEDFPLPQMTGTGETELPKLYSVLDKAIAFLTDRTSGRREPSAVLSVDELSELVQRKDISATAHRVVAVSDRLSELGSEEQDLTRQQDFLSEWSDLPVDLVQMNHSGLFRLRAGKVPSGDGFALLDRIKKEEELFDYLKLSESRALAMWHSESEEKILPKLTEAGFSLEDFSAYKRDPEEELSIVDKRLKSVSAETLKLNEEADTAVADLPGLKALFDAVGIELFRNNSAASGRNSSSALLLHAWISEADLPELKRVLEKLTEVDISIIQPEKDEIPPVHLSESATADPYMLLTDMYGQPQGQDPDPTPLFAPFYAMFFGICIGDAGYGLALAAGAGAGWYITEKRQGNSRLFRLLFQGGLASILWGILLGGWFGISFDRLPGLLQAAAMPLNNLVPGYTAGGDGFSLSNQFLYLTLGFGLVQLAWGIVVNLKKRLRSGEGAAAVIDQTGWMLALLGLFPWLFNHYLLGGVLYPTPGIWDNIFLAMLGAGALLIFVMGGREASGIGGKVGLGAYACYGIVNLLGDVLSYSRLFALALSSAIIASVVNQIAGMLSGSIPVFGVVLAVIVLAGGHLFNLAMAVLSGFIHTARLQFVEFFGKFYDGTGVPFTPLRYEPKYVRIVR